MNREGVCFLLENMASVVEPRSAFAFNFATGERPTHVGSASLGVLVRLQVRSRTNCQYHGSALPTRALLTPCLQLKPLLPLGRMSVVVPSPRPPTRSAPSLSNQVVQALLFSYLLGSGFDRRKRSKRSTFAGREAPVRTWIWTFARTHQTVVPVSKVRKQITASLCSKPPLCWRSSCDLAPTTASTWPNGLL